jgi:hypothetical protein
MSIKNHCITINLIITENKNDLSSIEVKDFLRQDKNFTNIDLKLRTIAFKIKNKNQWLKFSYLYNQHA